MIEQICDYLTTALQELRAHIVGAVSTMLMFFFGVVAWFMFIIAAVSSKPGSHSWSPFWSIGGLICTVLCLFFGFLAMVWLYRSATTGEWLRQLREGFEKHKPTWEEYVQYGFGVMFFVASYMVFAGALKHEHVDILGVCLALAFFYCGYCQIVITGSDHEERCSSLITTPH